jgi:AbrB family looped-hinge helix DNA binding protein
MATVATLSSKGQLVIPAGIRRKLRLKSGSKVTVEEANGEIRIKPNPFDALLALEGCLSHVKEDVEGWWIEEKRKEREREEAEIEELR